MPKPIAEVAGTVIRFHASRMSTCQDANEDEWAMALRKFERLMWRAPDCVDVGMFHRDDATYVVTFIGRHPADWYLARVEATAAMAFRP